MDLISIIVGSSWIIAGLVIIGVSIPLARGLVGRNRLYGVRLAASMKSDDAWYAINRFGGKRMIVWAVPLIVVGVVCFFIPLQQHFALALIFGFVPLIFVIIPIIEMYRFASRYTPPG